jgi:hypothetical protein
MPYVLDIETNAVILPSIIHCGVLINTETCDVFEFANQPGYSSIREMVGCVEEIARTGDKLAHLIRCRAGIRWRM